MNIHEFGIEVRKKFVPHTLAAAIVAAVGTTNTVAQDSLDDWEYEPGAGYHEQEWYDPSDWFDYEPGNIDYEEMDTEDEYDSYYGDYYSNYYDGYYDGYTDETDSLADRENDNGFSDGMSDGQYDREQGYGYDPVYYIYTVSTTQRDKQSDQQRSQDQNRQRGDRQKQLAQNDSKKMEHANKAAKKHREMTKIRGNVDSITLIRGNDEVYQGSGTPLIAKIELDKGRTFLVDLGPKMTEDNLPIEEGQRATLKGEITESDDRQVLVVHMIRSDGETARIASRGQNENMQRRDADANDGSDKETRTSSR